jgi:hypothetical protein
MRWPLAWAVLIGAAGCSSHHGCPVFCGVPVAATFDLSCAPTDLVSVSVSGVCATGDANPANYMQGPGDTHLSIFSDRAGVCDLYLTFATGFTYSASVTFAVIPSSDGCPSCAIGPTQGHFAVGNPSGTCGGSGDD